MWFYKLVLMLIVAYVAVMAVMYATQTWMLFPTGLAQTSYLPLPPSAAQLQLSTPDGVRLRGVHVPPTLPDQAGDQLIVLGFGGNAWNAEGLAAYLHGLFPHAGVVAFHYRGYRPSAGKPSAAALLADAPVIYDHLLATIGTRRIVAVGLSIGAGVAAHLATRRPLTGLILVSPFDSLEAVARHHYPWLPVGLLLRHHIPTIEFVRQLDIPAALITAERDTIVPPQRTDAVRRAIPALVLDRTIAQADHNDLYDLSEFRAAMTEALERMQ